MPINTVERFNKYQIDQSITTLGNVSIAIDYDEPLDFKNWLSNFTDTNISTQTFKLSYKDYLNSWNKVKNTFLENQNNDVKDQYIALLKDISLDVFTEQERNYLKALNYNDKNQLDSIIPLVSKKLKLLTSYYKNFREIVKTQPKKNNIFSSNIGLKDFLYQTFYTSLNFDSSTKSLLNIFNKNVDYILANVNFTLDELYDEYQDYYDLVATKPASAYQYGGEVRKDQWTSNTNTWDYDLWLDYNKSSIRLLSSYNYVIENWIPNLSLPISLNTNDTSYYKNKDFINQINTGDLNDLNLQNKKALFEKFIGTDYYYLSTGNTASSFISGNFLSASNVSSNYLNRNNVSTATTPNTAFLVREKDIGGFYKPFYSGILTYNTFNYSYYVDVEKLSANQTYFFPDPNKYIGTYGNSIYYKPPGLDIFKVNENARIVSYDISNSAAFGYINDRSYYPNFNGYENVEEINKIYNSGVVRDFDKVDFFKGKLDDVWSNNDIFEINNKALYPIDDRQQKLLVSIDDITYNTSDVYGNNYGVFKQSSPTVFKNISATSEEVEKRCLFLSNGLFYQDGVPFDYDIDTGSISGILPSQNFSYTGVQLSAVTFDEEVLNYLDYSRFNTHWCFGTGNYYKQGTTFEGGYFTTIDNVAMPSDPPTESGQWNTNLQSLYYSVLLEAGADKNGNRPTFQNTASFDYEYTDTTDCGLFDYAPFNNPFEINYINTSRFSVPYYDSVNPNLSTTYVEVDNYSKKTIYTKKFELSGTSYIRNANNYVYPLSAALSAVFAKYDNNSLSAIYDELNNNIIKYDIVYDIMIIETENYQVVEKIRYDFDTLQFLPNRQNPIYINRLSQGNKRLEKFGNFYFHESSNSILLNKTTLLPSVSGSSYRTLYPSIYRLEIDSLNFSKIFPLPSKNLNRKLKKYSYSTVVKPDYSNVSFDTNDYIYNTYEIDRPNLSYNPEKNNYSFTIKGKDMSDALSIYYSTYKFENGNFINEVNEVYFQQSLIRDENYFNSLTASFISYNNLPGTNGVVWNNKEGVLKLGEVE